MSFIKACKDGNIEKVRTYLNKKITEYELDYGFCWACTRGHGSIVRLLLDKVDYVDNAFLLAFNNEHMSIARLLIPLIYDVKMKFNYICVLGTVNDLKTFLTETRMEYSYLDRGFNDACRYERADIIKFLVDKDILSDSDLERGFNILCEYGHINIVRMIIGKVKDIKNGFHMACYNRRYSIIKFLVDNIHDYKFCYETAVRTRIPNVIKFVKELIIQKRVNLILVLRERGLPDEVIRKLLKEF